MDPDFNLKAKLKQMEIVKFDEVRKKFSSTHTWIRTKIRGCDAFKCSICDLTAPTEISYSFHDNTESVTDGLPVMNWRYRTMYLTCQQNLERKALKKVKGKPWVVYMLECEQLQNTIYTGITNNLYQRYMDHKEKRGAHAKYTATHYPISILYTETYPNRSLASKREYEIKQLNRQEKFDLAAGKKP